MPCNHELKIPSAISIVLSPFCYQGHVGTLIKRAKETRSISDALAVQKVCDAFTESLAPPLSWDYIAPIPPRFFSLQLRGFHLPLLLAESIADRYRKQALTRKESSLLRWRSFRYCSPQKFVSPNARSRNLSNCFRSKSIDLSGSSVLIIDDVISSGTTLLEAAKAIEQRNPDRIDAFCLAHSHQGVISRVNDKEPDRRTQEDYRCTARSRNRMPLG